MGKSNAWFGKVSSPSSTAVMVNDPTVVVVGAVATGDAAGAAPWATVPTT